MVALPLLGSAVLLFGGRRTDRWGPLAATLLSWASFVVGVLVILQLPGYAGDDRALQLPLWDWVAAGNLEVSAGLLMDPL